jgi:sarcosine oxidase subunit alpha
VLHERLNARFQDFGSWQRPECYPRAGESHTEAVHREVLAVRRRFRQLTHRQD